jgi:hypothetical protein
MYEPGSGPDYYGMASTDPASWRQVPTIDLGAAQEVVGEMPYQDQLRAVVEGGNGLGARRRLFTSRLVVEPDSEAGPNAVRVDVGAETVGHVADSSWDAVRPVVERLAREGRDATCRALIKGGWDRGPGKRGYIGVELLIGARPRPWKGRSAFLPGDPWHEALAVVELPSAGQRLPDKGTAVVSLAPVGNGAIAVQLDGTWIGHTLGRPDIAGYVASIAALGLPVTAKLRFHGGPTLCLADPDAVGDAIHSVGPVDPRSGGPVSDSGRWCAIGAGGCGTRAPALRPKTTSAPSAARTTTSATDLGREERPDLRALIWLPSVSSLKERGPAP